MIDFTKIQTFPVPPVIEIYQTEYNKLDSENKFLRNVLIGTSIVGLIMIGRHFYLKRKKNEKRISTKH